MNNSNILAQNLTTINIEVTIGLVVTLGVTGIGVSLIVKLVMDGKFWGFLAKIWNYANRKHAESSMNRVLRRLRKNPTLAVHGEDLGKKVRYEIRKDLHLDDVSEGETVLIALNSASNNPVNLTNAVLQYVSKSLLPKASMTLEPDLEKGVTYVVCREAFTGQNLITSRDYFDSKILPEEYTKNPNFEKLMESLRKIQKFGLLTKVILQQFVELNKLNFDTFEYSKIKKESYEFYKFIKNICEREERENSNLKFMGDFIKVRVILVSSSNQLFMGGAQHLLNRINNQYAFDYIYLIYPAINKDLRAKVMDGRKEQFLEIYKNTLKELGTGNYRFTLRKSQMIKAKNRDDKVIDIGISFLSRNY